jgi:glutamyl/glutaminyl-tRNA synthetase
LIGWSPGQNDELLPADELARRFKLENVAHSAGVFDENKLAWANRHYLKLCPPDRLATLAEPHLRDANYVIGPVSSDARAWLEFVVPPLATSVDTLKQLPDRMSGIFGTGAVSLEEEFDPRLFHALREELNAAPRLVDKDAFRALAARVKDKTGIKGKALFHPIRLFLTGEAAGPELDVLIPAIERAATLPSGSGLKPVIGCRERIEALASYF